MIEYLKEAFNLANRNMQLVFVRLAATVINIIGLIVCLGLPVTVALSYLSFDIIHAENLFPYFVEKPHEILSRYTGLVIFFLISVISYILFVCIVIIYFLGGMLGTLRNSTVAPERKFSLSSFFRQANENFLRLFRLVSVESLVFMPLFTVLIIAGGAVVSDLHGVLQMESIFEVFFRSFALMSIAVFSAAAFIIYLVVMLISSVVSAVEGTGTVVTLKKTAGFLRKNPMAFLFSAILFIGLIVSAGVLLAFKISVSPFFPGGMVLFIISAVLQNYLSVVAWGFLVVYYIRATNYPASSGRYEI
ncbi:MAG: hypothetical protein C4526_09995 [Nitrospiraceae bacterium]|nr:MAG: hypothetical protein C4526_09995 [Nitrospiraceae bacterium]